MRNSSRLCWVSGFLGGKSREAPTWLCCRQLQPIPLGIEAADLAFKVLAGDD